MAARRASILRVLAGIKETIVISWVMVVGAVMASLALGVLVAYGICQAMFRVFRLHAESAAESRSMSAAVTMEAIARN